MILFQSEIKLTLNCTNVIRIMFPLNFFGLLDISLRNSIILTVFIAGVIYYNVKRWKIYVLATKLEGPGSYPIIGCAHHLYGLDTSGNFVID